MSLCLSYVRHYWYDTYKCFSSDTVHMDHPILHPWYNSTRTFSSHALWDWCNRSRQTCQSRNQLAHLLGEILRRNSSESVLNWTFVHNKHKNMWTKGQRNKRTNERKKERTNEWLNERSTTVKKGTILALPSLPLRLFQFKEIPFQIPLSVRYLSYPIKKISTRGMLRGNLI